jgi:hypothetical protein
MKDLKRAELLVENILNAKHLEPQVTYLSRSDLRALFINEGLSS